MSFSTSSLCFPATFIQPPIIVHLFCNVLAHYCSRSHPFCYHFGHVSSCRGWWAFCLSYASFSWFILEPHFITLGWVHAVAITLMATSLSLSISRHLIPFRKWTPLLVLWYVYTEMYLYSGAGSNPNEWGIRVVWMASQTDIFTETRYATNRSLYLIKEELRLPPSLIVARIAILAIWICLPRSSISSQIQVLGVFTESSGTTYRLG